MAGNELRAPRGTRDFYPDEMRLRNWLFAHYREVARQFAFEEIDAPIVEHAELFIRKAGEEIVDQLYHFELHDRHLALRPELTPSISRMVIARAGALRFPVRWFTIGQNWRYERMTRGRKREHYQWDVEILGEAGVAAEAELLSAIFTLLERVGLGAGEVRVRVNSRALLEESLRAGALRDRPEAFTPLCIIIDKIGKIGRDAVLDLLCEPGGDVALSRETATEVVDRLEITDLDEALRGAPRDSAAGADLSRLFELVDAYGLGPWVQFDASVVRGLAYYTGIVFEGFDAGATLRAVFGGGRYDRLIETLGGPSLPAVGFGFGDVVIAELLADLDRLPTLRHDVADVVVALDESLRPHALRVARGLRGEGRAVEVVLAPTRLKRVLADASRAGVERVFLIGEDEASRGKMRVRELASREEHETPLPPA